MKLIGVNAKDIDFGKKYLSKDNSGALHYGVNLVPGFSKITKTSVEKALKGNKIWRYTVCRDLHIGKEPPVQCPTCGHTDAYVEINKKELLGVMKIL